MGKGKTKAIDYKKKVQEKVKKEYTDFLADYLELDEDKRFRKMVKDAEKIAFYRDFYIVIVIIGDIEPWIWRWLYVYYCDADIIKDFYLSKIQFDEDSEEEDEEKEDYSDIIHGYVMAKAPQQFGACA
jgi:hypothetical protein